MRLPLSKLVPTAILLQASLALAEPSAPQPFNPAPLEQQEKTLSSVLEKMPGSLSLLSRRGDARLFLGNFSGAVADYESMIALDPAQDAPHWRLGIAYYFHGDHAKAAKQFEKYHAFNARDRENGVWKFFSQALAENPEAARKGLLVYTQFDREPFPSIYKMLAGEQSPYSLFEEIERKGLQKEPQVMFFAKYYAGLFESLNGRKEKGLRLVREAVALFEAQGADRGGPGYMWHAARLHAALLETQSKR